MLGQSHLNSTRIPVNLKRKPITHTKSKTEMAKKIDKKVLYEKTYTLSVIRYADEIHLKRENNGFTPMELMGYLEMIQLEILQQVSGELKPDIVERTFVKPTKTEKK